ncbi:MAG TPA: L,D-transpeptidase [Pyrinomonadaceae bacterium]|nr:L,D-transpeptidase [Pyrinomonadaceae bacterium]
MRLRIVLLVLVSAIGFASCTTTPNSNNPTVTTTTASPTPSPSTSATDSISQVTLPVLDALLANQTFTSELKAKLQLTDDQIGSLKDVASREVARLRETNAEDATGDAAEPRERATKQIIAVLGEEKAKQFASLASDFWANAGEEGAGTVGREVAGAMPSQPNSVPTDTRIVVNIPAFRMDLFENGNLVKSYKVGIGYPEFPLPQGLRKAQTIIVNPTWTPPDEPWVAKMGRTPGEKIEAGSTLNPLGPIKIPIGGPSLIHGGKSPAKLGTFASHGCVGLTTAQVKDFARLLAKASGTELADATMEKYLKDRTTTKSVKLKQTVPVELRYETIVVEDGKLHIYKDVYAQNANTEENLRRVLETHGVRFDDLSADEKNQLLYALNAMSAKPKPMPSPSPLRDAVNANLNSNANKTASKKGKREEKKPKNVFVMELAALSGRGYPAPVNFDTGSGKPAPTVAAVR